MMLGLGMMFMLIIPILIIVGIVWLVVALTRGGQGSGTSMGAKQDSLEILKARYAKGEITKDQFDAMKLDLA